MAGMSGEVNAMVGEGKIFDFHVDVQDSILIVRTCYKYVFGPFLFVKTPPNDFRTVSATENHFWPG